MAAKVKQKNPTNKPVTTGNSKKPVLLKDKYLRKKIVLIVLIALLFLVLYIDSKTGFIKSIVGDKTIEFRMRK
jgi:uncharacterized membrane protein